MSRLFNTESFQHKLKSEAVGRKIVYLETTGSTMDDARKYGVSDASEYPHGTLVLAERQTKARGARDHKWDASNTGNLYVSIILHMPPHFKTFEGKFELEVAACLAVRSVTKRLGVEAIPKWPNDLWVKGHKLAGFLAEDSRYDIPDSNKCLIILGIGINVNADIRQNPDLHSIATSLMCERGGKPVSREEYLSDVCSALEQCLISKSDNLSQFRSLNLFQNGSDISVTCIPESRVIDGQFIQVADNWEVQFMNKRTKEVLQGRSDYYTIRPKVVTKILVVFAGISVTRQAVSVASLLTGIVDTSKYVVCSVPESAITQSDEWMRSCQLLVFADDVCDATRLTSKLKSYLKKGGNFLALGVASYYAAKTFDIPFREGVLESLADNTDFSVISIDCCKSNLESAVAGDGGDQGESTSSSHVLFQSSLVYFKFSEDFVLRYLTAWMQNTSVESVHAASDPENRQHVSFKYSQCDPADKEHSVAILTSPTTHGGVIALFGFNMGAVSPAHFPSISDMAERIEDKDLTNVEKIVKNLHQDRYRRDEMLIKVLSVLGVQ